MDLLTAAKKKDPQQLVCRVVLGHRWNPIGKVEIEGGMYIWTVACDGCTTERTLFLDAQGYNDHNSYKYPDGYKFEGFGQLTKAERAQLRRYVMENL
jgi:hypothetical protein